MRRVCIDAAAAKNLGGRVNDHLRYKLVNLCVQKTMNFFHGQTQPSRDCVAKFVRNCGWSDHERIMDNSMLVWKPTITAFRRSNGRTVPDVIDTDHGRAVSMFFCKLTSTFVNTSKHKSTYVTKRGPCSKFVKN